MNAALSRGSLFAVNLDLGIGEAAQIVRRSVVSVRETWWETVSQGYVCRNVFDQLQALIDEASRDDWDAYGASAVSGLVYQRAMEFARALPSEVTVPEITPEPDGEIAFEWIAGPRWVLSVSVGAHSSLSYAALFGANKVHGKERFIDNLPTAIAQVLARFEAGASVRAATSGASAE
jgi:hypothetical protein